MNIDRTEKIIRQGIPDEKMAVCKETLELISANLFEDEKCCTEKQKTGGSRRSVIKADQRKLCREGNSSGERKQHVNKNQ